MKIDYLSKEQLSKRECADIKNIMNVIEESLIDFKEGKIKNPDKISQIFNELTQDRINCMPATLVEKNICGMKWVSVFPQNPQKYNIPNVNAVILLSNTLNGLPIVFMDGTLITALRTAGMGGIAAKYLARKNSEIIGFIGAGEQAKNHLISIKSVIPNLKVCRVSDKYSENAKRFVDNMKKVFPNMSFEICNSDYKNAVDGADIIVTATSGQEQLLKSEWIKEGAFYCHVGGLEDDFDVPKMADKIVCDDWECVKHRKQTISVMYEKGDLKDSDIYGNIVDITTNQKSGRENDKEFIYFNSVGLSYIDIAIANEFYKSCKNSDVILKMEI